MTIQYFGFYANGYTSLGDKIAETSNYSNLAWLHGSESPEKLLEKLELCRKLQYKALIVVQYLLFESVGDVTSTSLMIDANQRFSQLWEQIKVYDDVILGFAIFDEPYRSNKNHVGLPTKTVTTNLNSCAYMIKQVCDKITVVTGAGNEFDSYGIPDLVDWIGMYRYSYNTIGLLLGFSFFNLLRQLKSHQKIMAIADAIVPSDKVYREEIDQKRIVQFNGMWKWLCGFTSKVIAVCPYIYQTTKELGIGAESMPLVLGDLKVWGYKIVGSSLTS